MGRRPLEVGRSIYSVWRPARWNAGSRPSTESSTPADLAARETKTSVGRNEVAELTIRTKAPIAFDLYSDFEVTGRFVLVDQYDVSGGGIITEAVKDEHTLLREEARRRDIAWVKGVLASRTGPKYFGHRAALVLITGARHTAKVAAGPPPRSAVGGRRPPHVPPGRCQPTTRFWTADLSEEDTGEIVRRFRRSRAPVDGHGPDRRIHDQRVRRGRSSGDQNLGPPTPLITVHMSKGAEAPPPIRSGFAGPKDFEAIADRVIEELKARGVLAQAIGANPSSTTRSDPCPAPCKP